MRRLNPSTLSTVLSALVTLGLVVMANLRPLAASPATPQPAQRALASLDTASPGVQTRVSEAEPLAPAVVGQTLGAGAEIQTDDRGTAQINFEQGAVVRLASYTTVIMASLPLTPDGPVGRLQLITGKIWVSLRGGGMEVATRGGVAAVRGSFAEFEYREVKPDTAAEDVMVVRCLEGLCAAQSATQPLITLGNLEALMLTFNGEPPVRTQLGPEAVDAFIQNNPDSAGLSPTLTAAAISPTQGATREASQTRATTTTVSPSQPRAPRTPTSAAQLPVLSVSPTLTSRVLVTRPVTVTSPVIHTPTLAQYAAVTHTPLPISTLRTTATYYVWPTPVPYRTLTKLPTLRVLTRTPTRSWTPAPTKTATPTATSAISSTVAATASPSATTTATATFTLTVTATSTETSTGTVTNTITATSTATATHTATSTATFTATVTHTPTNTATSTGTAPYTATSTATPTATAPYTATSTATLTPTFTYTATSTATAVETVTNTATSTATPTPTITETSTNILVNTTTDGADPTPGDGVCETAPGNGMCSLRAAVQEANGLGGPRTITLPAGNYLLTLVGAGEDAAATGDLDITGQVALLGAGAGITFIDAGALGDRVIQVVSSTALLQMTGVTLQNGNLASGDGGGLYNGGTLILNNSVVTGNTAVTGQGGGLFAAADSVSTLDQVWLKGNQAASGGGMVAAGEANHPATLAVTASAFTANTADSNSTAIYVDYGTGLLVNVTISSNISGTLPAFLAGLAAGPLALTNVTVANNYVGLATSSGDVQVANSILSSNVSANCTGTFTSLGHNLDSADGCAPSLTAATDHINASAGLDTLGNYGGLTPTHRLQADSPAREAGDNALCPATDQREINRPQGASCDIGAVEYQPGVDP